MIPLERRIIVLKPKSALGLGCHTPPVTAQHPSLTTGASSSFSHWLGHRLFQLTCQEEQCIIFQHLSNLKAIRFQRSAWHVKLPASAEELCEAGFIKNAEAERPMASRRCCTCGTGGQNHTAKVLKHLLGRLLSYYKSILILSLAEPQFGVPRPDSQGQENPGC